MIGQIELIAVEGLIPYVNNSRTHSEQQIMQVAASIREFGFTNPILVDAANMVIAGHGRLQAAMRLGLTEVPCIRLEHLTETQKRAYIIADNKLAMNAGWDMELLRLELGGLEADDYDLSVIGFSPEELDALNPDFEPGNEDDQGKLDELDPIWISCPHCGKEFNQRDA